MSKKLIFSTFLACLYNLSKWSAGSGVDYRSYRPPRKMEVLECKVSKNLVFRPILEYFSEVVLRGGGNERTRAPLIEFILLA